MTINLDQGKVDKALAFVNEERAATKPPQTALTAEQWVEERFGRILDNTVSQANAVAANKIVEAFSNASKDDQDQVKALLKI